MVVVRTSGVNCPEQDVTQLNSAGIGIRIPMSNHFVERDEYSRTIGRC